MMIRAIHLPRSPQRLKAREVANTAARIVTISTTTTSVINKRCGCLRSDSTSAPRAGCFFLKAQTVQGTQGEKGSFGGGEKNVEDKQPTQGQPANKIGI